MTKHGVEHGDEDIDKLFRSLDNELFIDEEVRSLVVPEENELVRKWEEERTELEGELESLYPDGIPADVDRFISEELERRVPGSGVAVDKMIKLHETLSKNKRFGKSQ